MKVNIENKDQYLAGIMLHNEEFCNKVTESDEWKGTKNPREIEARLTICGIEVDAQLVEDFFNEVSENYSNHLRIKYNADNIDKLVEERAEELLKERADNVLEKLYNLQRTLEESSNIITPYWERESK